MSNMLLEISKALNIPVADVLKSSESLQKIGLIFTAAPSFKIALENPDLFPIRVVGGLPTDPKSPSQVSFGPFPLKRENYERMRRQISEQGLDAASETFAVLLGFFRLAYEKTGVADRSNYRLSAGDDDLDRFLALMDFWDVYNPQICEEYVWISPTSDCKQYVSAIAGKHFEEDDYSWWDIRADAGDIQPQTLNDYPDEYVFLPNELMTSWNRYLPAKMGDVVRSLYAQATRGGTWRNFKTLPDILRCIGHSIEDDFSIDTTNSSAVDRELLIKELCDYNSLPYPVDSVTAYEYLHSVGIIKTRKTKNRMKYSLVRDLPKAEDIFRFPEEWQDRVDTFLTTGSVLFSYLTLDEIVVDK